jgi:hypothetical protein
MTIVLTAKQNSPLVIDSSNYSSKINKYLICFTPLSMTFDSANPNMDHCGTFSMDLWKTNDNIHTRKKIENFNN